NTLARTHGSLWEMLPWHAPRREQAGARPVSQPPAPACEPLPVMKVDIPRSRPCRDVGAVMFAVKLTEFASGRRFGFLQAPELKSFGIDCLFDRAPREVVRRSVIRADRAGGGPGTMVLRELAAHEVAREGPQISPRFRLENVNSHGLTLSAVDDGRQTCGPALEVGAHQIVRAPAAARINLGCPPADQIPIRIERAQ